MGRPKGSVNRNRAAMLSALKQRLGDDFDPVMMMGEQAMEVVKIANDSKTLEARESAIGALDKVAQYITPKLKATELDISNPDGTMRPLSAIQLIAHTGPPVEPEGTSEALPEPTKQIESDAEPKTP